MNLEPLASMPSRAQPHCLASESRVQPSATLLITESTPIVYKNGTADLSPTFHNCTTRPPLFSSSLSYAYCLFCMLHGTSTSPTYYKSLSPSLSPLSHSLSLILNPNCFHVNNSQDEEEGRMKKEKRLDQLFQRSEHWFN